MIILKFDFSNVILATPITCFVADNPSDAYRALWNYPSVLWSDIGYFVTNYWKWNIRILYYVVYTKLWSNDDSPHGQISFVKEKLIFMSSIYVIRIIFNRYSNTIGITSSFLCFVTCSLLSFVNIVLSLFFISFFQTLANSSQKG